MKQAYVLSKREAIHAAFLTLREPESPAEGG